MSNTSISISISLSFLCGVIFSDSGFAEEPFVCDLYANKAVAQAETSKQYSCGLTGNRYSADKTLHYKWCLQQTGSLPASENRARTVELSNCEATNWNRDADAYCTDYANTAVAQAKMAQQYNCGFSKSRWNTDFGPHYRWCMGVPGAWPESETSARRLGLKQCSGKVFPPPTPNFSGDLKVVDWCFEDRGNDTLFDIVIRNVGGNIWSSKKDGLLIVGLSSVSGPLTEPRRIIPFTELYGISPQQTRIIRGVSMLSITAKNHPRADVVLSHDEDANTSDRSLKVVFGTSSLPEFFTKYSDKRCKLF